MGAFFGSPRPNGSSTDRPHWLDMGSSFVGYSTAAKGAVHRSMDVALVKCSFRKLFGMSNAPIGILIQDEIRIGNMMTMLNSQFFGILASLAKRRELKIPVHLYKSGELSGLPSQRAATPVFGLPLSQVIIILNLKTFYFSPVVIFR